MINFKNLLIVLLAIQGCDYGRKSSEVKFSKIDLVDKDCYGCSFYGFYTGESTYQDSIYIIGPDSLIKKKIIFKNKEVSEIHYYRKTSEIKNSFNSKIEHLKYFKGVELYKYYNNVDSYSIVYFGGGKEIKEFRKFNYSGDYYLNEFDSISHHLIRCQRSIRQKYSIIGDSIFVTPYFECRRESLDNYTITYVILNSTGLVDRTFLIDKKQKFFVLPNAKHYDMIKVVCDSVGCFSIKTEYTNYNFGN